MAFGRGLAPKRPTNTGLKSEARGPFLQIACAFYRFSHGGSRDPCSLLIGVLTPQSIGGLCLAFGSPFFHLFKAVWRLTSGASISYLFLARVYWASFGSVPGSALSSTGAICQGLRVCSPIRIGGRPTPVLPGRRTVGTEQGQST